MSSDVSVSTCSLAECGRRSPSTAFAQQHWRDAESSWGGGTEFSVRYSGTYQGTPTGRRARLGGQRAAAT
jgi:hypothetical protein